MIRDAAGVAVQSAIRLARPDARYVVVPIKSLRNGDLELENQIRFHCPAFDKLLDGCDMLLAFVITIGPALDDTVVSLVHDTFEPLDALFLETAGWLTIEAATKQLASHLKGEFSADGWRFSVRMGPGYEYRDPNSERRVSWDLTEQQQLFKLFAGNPLPIELMSSSAMQPKMSRSGVFGLYPSAA